jgi:nuclear pore complex protein Nup98-Nup96
VRIIFLQLPNQPHSLLGAFGTTNTNANTSAFGVKPATGFGAFSGGTGAFGGGTTTGTFGQPVNNQASTSTSVFGAPANTNTTSAFGTFNKTFGGEFPRALIAWNLSTLFKVQQQQQHHQS